MANILLHDTRVIVATPPRSDFYKAIQSHMDLETALNDLAAEITGLGRGNGTGNTLNILAHGGPAGILLGSPGLSQLNVGAFSRLYHTVSTIIFHSCAATRVYAGPHSFNGARMCQLLSLLVECTVVGADVTQYLNLDTFYNSTNNVQYAPWQGNVTVYRNGSLISTSTPTLREAGFMPY